MARPVQNYQPVLRSYPRSRKVNAVSLGAEATYLRLLTMADCAGRFLADPAVFAGLVWAERLARGEVSGADVARWLDELEGARLIRRYACEGERLLEVVSYFRPANNRVQPQYPGPSGAVLGVQASPVTAEQLAAEVHTSPTWGRDVPNTPQPSPRTGVSTETETETETETKTESGAHAHPRERDPLAVAISKTLPPPSTDVVAAARRWDAHIRSPEIGKPMSVHAWEVQLARATRDPGAWVASVMDHLSHNAGRLYDRPPVSQGARGGVGTAHGAAAARRAAKAAAEFPEPNPVDLIAQITTHIGPSGEVLR